MSTITIHTENEKQISLLKNLLQELKIKFEVSTEENLTEWQKEKIMEGIRQADQGEFYTEKESKEILDQCFR